MSANKAGVVITTAVSTTMYRRFCQSCFSAGVSAAAGVVVARFMLLLLLPEVVLL